MRVHHWTWFVLFLWTSSAVVESANVLSVCSNCTHTTINSAVVFAAAGDIVVIAPGNYNEPQTSIGFPLTFQATDGDVYVSTTSTYYNTWLIISSTLTLNGSFTINGGCFEVRGALYQYGTLKMVPAIRAILLYKGQWHQYGHAHLISTGGANGVINLSGEWNQYGTVLLEATGETGVFLGVFSGPPGVWNQYGSAEIVVLQGNGLVTQDTFACAWRQEGKLNVTALSTSNGVVLNTGATWTQLNSSVFAVDDQSNGVSLAGAWTQQSSVKMTIRERSVGVPLNNSAAYWTQQAIVSLDITGPSGKGVFFSGIMGTWEQNSGVEMHVTGNTSNGVLFTQSGQAWLQSSDVSIDVQGQLSCGINVGEAGPSVWKQIGPEPSLNAPGLGSSGLCPIPLPSPSVEIISVKINSTRPSVEISPWNSSAAEGGAGQKVQLDFLSLREITPLGVIVWQAQLQEGWLMNGNMSSNSSYTSTFTSRLANNATLTYQFSTFDDFLILTLANNYTFSITPAFIKFSLRLDRWNWSSSDNKLQFQMAINPPFATSEVRHNTPQANVTTLLLRSARESDASMILRLLDFGLTNSSERVACSSMVDSTDSSLTITFDHFDTDLDYDPDISLLFGRAGHGGGDGGAQWVIAVAVAVPAAVVLVVLIIGVIMLVAYVHNRRRNTQAAVNFDGMGGDADEL